MRFLPCLDVIHAMVGPLVEGDQVRDRLVGGAVMGDALVGDGGAEIDAAAEPADQAAQIEPEAPDDPVPPAASA